MRWKLLLRILDALALVAIVQSYWGIDIAAYAPQLIGPPLWPWHYGLYWFLMYVQGIIAGLYLFARAVTSK